MNTLNLNKELPVLSTSKVWTVVSSDFFKNAEKSIVFNRKIYSLVRNESHGTYDIYMSELCKTYRLTKPVKVESLPLAKDVKLIKHSTGFYIVAMMRSSLYNKSQIYIYNAECNTDKDFICASMFDTCSLKIELEEDSYVHIYDALNRILYNNEVLINDDIFAMSSSLYGSFVTANILWINEYDVIYKIICDNNIADKVLITPHIPDNVVDYSFFMYNKKIHILATIKTYTHFCSGIYELHTIDKEQKWIFKTFLPNNIVHAKIAVHLNTIFVIQSNNAHTLYSVDLTTVSNNSQWKIPSSSDNTIDISATSDKYQWKVVSYIPDNMYGSNNLHTIDDTIILSKRNKDNLSVAYIAHLTETGKLDNISNHIPVSKIDIIIDKIKRLISF
jgi:hypothetical protein